MYAKHKHNAHKNAQVRRNFASEGSEAFSQLTALAQLLESADPGFFYKLYQVCVYVCVCVRVCVCACVCIYVCECACVP